jgi:hypothetical protein
MKKWFTAVCLKSGGAITLLFIISMTCIVTGMPYTNPAFAMEINQSDTSDCPLVTAAFGCGGNDAWGANIFTPSENGILTEVGTHFLKSNSSYEIRIYDKFSSGTFSSQLGTSVSGSVTDAGYYMVPLPTPILVNKGDSFAIVVKFTTPGYSYPLPMESSASPSGQGQSYYSCDGSYFMDTKTYLDTSDSVSIIGVVLTDTDGDGIIDIDDPCPAAKPARIIGTSQYFSSLQDAFAESNLVSGNVIGCHDVQFEGPLVYDQNKTVTLRGGYDCGYSSASDNTSISGSLTIINGTLIADRIILN